MSDCLFCKIAAGIIPSKKVFDNEHIVAFRDIQPQAPTHILIIPRKHIPTINDVAIEDQAIIGEMFLVAKELSKQEQIDNSGYRLVFNCNRDAGQAVYHIHLHLLGGRKLDWPPG
jgi:histidine triad (HIT) family protein